MVKAFDYEYANEADRFYDYCLKEYKPKNPFSGKLRSSNLLFNFIDALGHGQPFHDAVHLIRQGIGAKKTVWGVKKKGDLYAYEFYFYNYDCEKKDRPDYITDLLELIRPMYRCPVRANENLPYFMFSIDFLPGFHKQEIDGIHVYYGGFSYFLSQTGMTMENHYAFYNPDVSARQIAIDVMKSAYVDYSKVHLREVLRPELVDCKTVCRAHKPTNDGVYFCGVDVDQFLFFLDTFDYPEAVVSFIRENKDQLNHLQYDVGFDYTMEDGKIKYLKSGYYGIF